MERITLINTDRLLWCCQDFGITLDDLAREVGISPDSLHGLLADEPTGLTFNQLSKVAEYFGRGVLFFLETTAVEGEQVHSPQFRTLTNQKPQLAPKLRKLVERVERQRDIYLSLVDSVPLDDIPTFSPPDLSPLDFQQSALGVREWLGLGNRSTFDSYRKAVENRGILVFQSNGYAGKWQIPKNSPVLGFSLYDPRLPVIVVRKEEWPARQVFTLFHELSHLLLHRTSFIDEDADIYGQDDSEKAANKLAGLILVPNGFLDRVDLDRKPADIEAYNDWLKPYRDQWGVSGEVIMRRLMDEGRVTEREYQDFRRWSRNMPAIGNEGGNRAYRHREPAHIFGDRFVRAVLEAKNAQRITLTRSSRYLDDLKIKDLHLLERHLVGS